MRAYLGVIKLWLSLLAAAVLLTGCLDGGGGGIATTSISGTAATGAALTGTVDLVDANGVSKTVTIGANGAFTVDTTGLAAPFMLRATGNGNNAGVILFSLADGVTGIFNITPLTHLAMELIRQDDPTAPATLAALFAAWNAQVDPADLAAAQAAMLQAQAVINANLATQFQANGLVPATFDFLHAAFAPDLTGIDAVIHAINLTINGNQIGLNVGGNPFNFNIAIDTTGFTIGGVAGGGGGGGANANCANGSTTMTFADNPNNAGPYNNGEQVCFTASTATLAFSGKTLANPVQNMIVSAPYSAYTFTDAATGNKYEVVFNGNALYEINVLNGAADFLGQFTPAAGNAGGGAGGAGSLTLSVSVQGAVATTVTIDNVPKPADQAEFCGAINDAQSSVSLNQALTGVGGTFTILSCSFNGSVGTVSADLHITQPVVMTVPYSVVYTYN